MNSFEDILFYIDTKALFIEQSDIKMKIKSSYRHGLIAKTHTVHIVICFYTGVPCMLQPGGEVIRPYIA